MVPIARSGHGTKSGIRHFKASLNNPDRAEGVAGRTFPIKKWFVFVASRDLTSRARTMMTRKDMQKRALLRWIK